MPTKKKTTKKATKPAAKKSPGKASREGSSKSKGKRMALVCANPDQCFWTTDGRVLSNLVELRDSLSDMADEVFEFHVNKDKNDFANWVGSVLEDPELAKALQKAKKSKTARTVVVRRLKIYDL